MQITHMHMKTSPTYLFKQTCILIFKTIVMAYIAIFLFQKTNLMCSQTPNSSIDLSPIKHIFKSFYLVGVMNFF